MDADRTAPDVGFLRPAAPSPGAQRLFAGDRAEVGHVMNLSHAWAHLPDAHEALFRLLGEAADAAGVSFRQRGVLVAAAAAALRDPHCALAWGTRLAGETDPETAAAVLEGDDTPLDPTDRALARWARKLVHDPNATDPGDVQALRDAGFDDARIAALTLYIALRIAFSTVNEALGARPDRELFDRAPAAVRGAVTFGRPVAGRPEA
ncbi:carboxymuconolactone decarboxylase family protein [Blastococcus deserti]|uniref:Carboxymuconolactone decarboxylase family protein n=1 Tax=Blastococcus deserti TaxID=2259033 RepID=A0ABW4XAT0_9ACTN